MTAAAAVILSLLLASPVGATLTLPQMAALAGLLVKALPSALRANRALVKELQSPSFRAWVAANGEAAIRLQPGERTER